MFSTSDSDAAARDYRNAYGGEFRSAAELVRRSLVANVHLGADGLSGSAFGREADGDAQHLYAGNAGVALYLIESCRAYPDADTLNVAIGAVAKAAALSEPNERSRWWRPGLYDGASGIGFVLLRLYEVSGDDRYFGMAVACVEQLQRTAQFRGEAARWIVAAPRNHSRVSPNDVISGSAGIGLFLLNAASCGVPGALALARAAGLGLLTAAVQLAPGECLWLPTAEDRECEYPNFSHGTAGVAYFLCQLFLGTGEDQFLEAGIAGARHLQRIALRTASSCLVPRWFPTASSHRPPQAALYSQSWCHGASGTARLWYALWRATTSGEWRTLFLSSARSLFSPDVGSDMDGIYADGVIPGNGLCHGLAGNANFLLEAYRATAEIPLLHAAMRMIGTCWERRSIGEDALVAWDEPTVSPRSRHGCIRELGYSRGIAGIGVALLSFDAFLCERAQYIPLPDVAVF